MSQVLSWLRVRLGRIWLRLLLVNVTVVLVPVAGLEFARIYERQLLSALERDMNDQGALTRALLEADLRDGVALGDLRHRSILQQAATRTRTRIRILDPGGKVVIDSHRFGPPEGPEPEPPKLYSRSIVSRQSDVPDVELGAAPWPAVAQRSEVRAALAGHDAAQTRLARKPRAVFLFTATPVYGPAHVGAAQPIAGAVYVTRSTRPVLQELYRVRSGLFKVLTFALVLSVGVTLLLAFSISRPLSRLSRAAKRIAAGQRDVALPIGGSGEIRELAQSFKTMKDELDSRLAYISEFSADVAHEFKSPLTSIRGAAELLAEGAHEDPEARERFLANILLDTQRLDRLVSRLLLLSRIESRVEGMTLVDLRSLLERVVTRINASPASGQAGAEGEPGGAGAPRVQLHYAAHHTWLRGREQDLEIAISNLIDNARRYSPADGVVVVEARDPLPSRREQASLAPGRREHDRFPHGIVISVCDSGPGIPEAKQAKVFERFYTTDSERGGTGLGLAIVDTVARAHGGRVSLESRAAQGSCFRIWLPREKNLR